MACWVLTCWVLAVAIPLPVGAQGLYLHVISTATPQGLPSLDGDPWPVALSVHDVEAALKILPESLDAALVAVEDLGDGAVPQKIWLWVTEDQVVGGEVEARHLESSFVIDFEEAPVVALSDRLRGELAGSASSEGGPRERPSIEAIAQLTYDSIPKKDISRGWDFASRIAQKGEGDCTEHAVLLVALARAFGYPARVVVGLALAVPIGDTSASAGTFGHAWAEIHDGQRWHAVDATQIDRESGFVVRRLPLQIFDNEGPGYITTAVSLLQTFPKHVEILRFAPGMDH